MKIQHSTVDLDTLTTKHSLGPDIFVENVALGKYEQMFHCHGSLGTYRVPLCIVELQLTRGALHQL